MQTILKFDTDYKAYHQNHTLRIRIAPKPIKIFLPMVNCENM